MIEYKDIKAADLEDTFLELVNVSYSGDVFFEEGIGRLTFAIKGGSIYKIDAEDEEQEADPTKGEMVVTTADKKVRWRQKHEVGNIYAQTYLGEADFRGDAGIPMIDALNAYLKGTYAIYEWDANIVNQDGIVERLIIDGKRQGRPNVTVTSDDDSATVKVGY